MNREIRESDRRRSWVPDQVRDDGVRPIPTDGRYVLIGGNIKDQDDYETPMSRASGRWMKGVEVHAHMLANSST